MAFKKTHALIRGSWAGDPYDSIFTQYPTVFETPQEFFSYVEENLTELILEYETGGNITNRQRELSTDGKVLISTIEFDEEASYNDFISDPRLEVEETYTKTYVVAEAPTPGDVNTFDEPSNTYYHTSDHLF